MKKYRILLALMLIATVAGAQNWYKAVYMQTYNAGSASGTATTPYRYLEFHTDERYSNCVMTDYRDPELKKEHNDVQKKVAAAEWIPVAGLIDYRERIVITHQGTRNVCDPLQENISAITATGRTRKIENYDCQAYTGLDRQGHPILLWTTKQLPWFINCGLYLPQIRKVL